MKSGWLILAGALLIGIAGFSARLLCESGHSACIHGTANSRNAEVALAWMKSEFKLSDNEFKEVCALHESYLPECDAMCERVAQSSAKLSSQLMKDGARMTPEVEAALHDYETLRAECLHAMLRHISDTAAVMRPEAGRAFMEKVLPHLLATHQHVSEVTR